MMPNGTLNPYSRRRGSSRRVLLFLFAGVVFCVQVLVNVILYAQVQLQRPTEDPQLHRAIDELQAQIQKLQDQLPPRYQDDGVFYPFTIRDSRRLVPTQISPQFHIFDYVDLDTAHQKASDHSKLYHNAKFLGIPSCQKYNLLCYKQKILQVFGHILEHTNATYFFYMESDNELCVPLKEIQDLTYRYQRYFISTGIGFSGWIMRRDFLQDFYDVYKLPHKDADESPDPIGSILLMEKNAWAVTRQYLVSHTIKSSVGATALTVGKRTSKQKHLPRCFEPRRGKWPTSDNNTNDMYGWDYFDYEQCPPEAEIYPCQDGQLESLNSTARINDTIATPGSEGIGWAFSKSNLFSRTRTKKFLRDKIIQDIINGRGG
jgi:hypothetical protein